SACAHPACAVKYIMRAPFPCGRKFFALLALAGAIIVGAWWWTGPPRDPGLEGQRLSEVVFDQNGLADFAWEHPAELYARLHGYGPAGVKWLTYYVEHGQDPSEVRRWTRLFARAPEWVRRHVPVQWGGLRGGELRNERLLVSMCLQVLGEESGPAI